MKIYLYLPRWMPVCTFSGVFVVRQKIGQLEDTECGSGAGQGGLGL